MNNLQLINDFPTTKKGIEELSNQLIQSTLEGEQNPLLTEIKVAALVKTIKTYRASKEIKECVLARFERDYPNQKSYDMGNVNLKASETGVKYDYTNCGDPVWERLTAEIEKLKEQLKERETILKANPKQWTYIDEKTGEVYTINPAPKSSTTQVVITIK